MKAETRKQVYFWGAMWNFGFAISGLVLPKLTMWIISGSWDSITGILPRTFFALFWVAVGVFGIGYYLVSRDPDRNEAVIWTGCTAKIIIFFTFFYLYFIKQATVFGFLSAFGDFIWTFLFLAAQRSEKSKKKGVF